MHKTFHALSISTLLMIPSLCGALTLRDGAPQMQTVSLTREYDVFVPICKYIEKGDTEALSKWFADNLDISIFGNGGDASSNQAKQILKSFFNAHTPHSFTVSHAAGQGNMKYVLGELNAGGERFHVTVFVSCKNDNYRIQQLIIDRN